MLPGIVVTPLRRSADERGFFTEVMRSDWAAVFQDDVLVANISVSCPGIMRAWHRHELGQIGHFSVICGAIKKCAFDNDIREPDSINGKADERCNGPWNWFHPPNK
jgi:dTDP-4-dehydrorhamnose 3,5-epimerase